MIKFNKNIKVTEEYIELNGIKQYILHLESSKDKPVLLFLHGGPGAAESLSAHLMQENWEKKYTVVHWDQRGAGKTLSKNFSNNSFPTIEILIDDLKQLIDYLKDKYNKEKIAILGHSWGSVLGSLFIKRYPENISYYIGVGQVISMIENEKIGYLKLKEEILKANNKSDLKKYNSIGEYPKSNFDEAFLNSLKRVRKLQGKYKLAVNFDLKLTLKIIKGPIFKFSDLLSAPKAVKANMNLLKYLFESYDLSKESLEYTVPVYYILGDKDWQTPYTLAEKYFKKIKAPKKELFFIKNAGHMTMLDQPSEFYNALCKCTE